MWGQWIQEQHELKTKETRRSNEPPSSLTDKVLQWRSRNKVDSLPSLTRLDKLLNATLVDILVCRSQKSQTNVNKFLAAPLRRWLCVVDVHL